MKRAYEDSDDAEFETAQNINHHANDSTSINNDIDEENSEPIITLRSVENDIYTGIENKNDHNTDDGNSTDNHDIVSSLSERIP